MAKSSTLYSQTENGFQRPKSLFLREGEQSVAQFRQCWDNNSCRAGTDRCLMAVGEFMRNWSEEPHFVNFCCVSHLGRLISHFFPQSNTNTASAPLWPQAVHSCQMEMVYNETKSERKSTVIRGMPSLLLKQSAYIPNLTKSTILLLKNRLVYIYIYIYI
jgi:hypothetical protein